MGNMMKVELCERKVVRVKRMSDTVMVVVLVFERGVLRLVWRCSLLSGKSLEAMESFL